jgi:RNA polymerase sigma factor (sigma-70 family)
VEASALRAPANISRLSISLPLLRLRSDEQLIALFRAGSDNAFQVIHDRYRQRLFAYVRQMLSAHSRQDAEDVLQDVFVRAFGALRADQRDVNVRAWLYRVAHNRCIDHLRRPVPAPAEVLEMSRTPLHDPLEEAQRREDLRRLVQDVGRLPEQQRSALLMREIDGMSYADLAAALDVTVPAVKSLLVRARVGLVEAAEARNTDCTLIRADLVAAYDRGVKASGRARRHMRECSGCREYRTALRGVRTSFAALSPGVAGPLALLAKLGLGGGAAAGSGAAAGGSGGGAVAGGAVAGATACKVAAVVCTAAITAGGAVEVKRLASERSAPAGEHAAKAIKSTPPLASRDAVKRALTSAAATAPAPISAAVLDRPTHRAKAEKRHSPAATGEAEAPAVERAGPGGSAFPGDAEPTGGVTAPIEEPVVSPQAPSDSGSAPGASEPVTPGTIAPADPEATGPAPASSPAPSSGGASPPAGSH